VGQYSTSFDDSDYPISQFPPDWTERWTLGDSGEYTTMTVEHDSTGCSHGDQILDMVYTMFQSEHAAASFDDVGTPVDADVKARVRFLGGVDADSVGVVVRGGEDSSGYYGYVASINERDNSIRVTKFNGALSPTQVAKSYVAPTIDFYSSTTPIPYVKRWYWIRLQVDGSDIKAKFWSDADPEPELWDIETTDSDVSVGGWAGVYNYAGDGEVDWFGAGTSTDTPPNQPAASGDALVTQMAVEVLRDNVVVRPVVVVVGAN